MNRLLALFAFYIIIGVASLFSILTLIAIVENAVERGCT